MWMSTPPSDVSAATREARVLKGGPDGIFRDVREESSRACMVPMQPRSSRRPPQGHERGTLRPATRARSDSDRFERATVLELVLDRRTPRLQQRFLDWETRSRALSRRHRLHIRPLLARAGRVPELRRSIVSARICRLRAVARRPLMGCARTQSRTECPRTAGSRWRASWLVERPRGSRNLVMAEIGMMTIRVSGPHQERVQDLGHFLGSSFPDRERHERELPSTS